MSDRSMEFHRTKRLPPYVFEEVNRLKARLRAEGADIIDFGMGNPDLPTPPQHILDKLKDTVEKPRTNGYSASRGIPGLRKAQARYYKRRFGVDLDPDKEVIVTLARRKALPISPRRSPRRAMLSWHPRPPIRSTHSAS